MGLINRNRDIIPFKIWVLIAAFLFIIGIGAGLVISATMPAGITDMFSDQLSAFGELSEFLAPFQATTAVFIFFKNIMALAVSFVASPLFCLLPVITLLLNGALISFVGVIFTQEAPFWLLLVGLLPHGIIEIPALIIGEAAALNFGAAIVIGIFSVKRRSSILPAMIRSARLLLLAAILMVPAAIIETFVTPLFLQ